MPKDDSNLLFFEKQELKAVFNKDQQQKITCKWGSLCNTQYLYLYCITIYLSLGCGEYSGGSHFNPSASSLVRDLATD